MDLDRFPSPLGALLARQARERGDRPAIVSLGERLTLSFADVAARAAAWAPLLRGTGPLAALATGNRASFVELFFGLRAAGVPVLLIDGAREPRELVTIASALHASCLLHVEPALGGRTPAGAPDPSVRVLDLGGAAEPPPGTALIKLTSGSTLDPRGACFTEDALVEGIRHIAEGMELTAADRVLIAIPLSHSYGFDNGVLSLAAVGTPLILEPDRMPAALGRTLAGQEITFFPAVPALLRALAAVGGPRPARLRSVISASAPLGPDVARAFAARFGVPVREFYGATECGGITFERRPGETAAEGTVGYPLPGVRLELADGDAVRVHSAANRFALWNGSAQPAPAHVETGDRAAWTPEGRLRLLGRTAHVANIAGFKVDLASIETFFRALPGVADAAALPVDDAARGQRIVVCVETDGHSAESLREICRGSLSPGEVPREIRVVPRLPRTERGKLDRAALAALVGNGRDA